MSNDGITLSAQSLGISTTNMFSVAYGNQMFVAVGNAGLIYVRAGCEWMKPTSNVTSPLNSVGYGNGLFVAVGDDGVVLMSEDTLTWIQQPSPEAVIMHSVTYGKNRVLAVGEGGKCLRVELISKISLVS